MRQGVYMLVPISPLQSPVSLSTFSVAREIWIWGFSAHTWKERHSEGSTSHISSGTFGQGVKVMDPRRESRVPIQLGLDFSTFPGGSGGGTQMALPPDHQKETGHSPCLMGPFAGDSGPQSPSRPTYGSISSSSSAETQQAPPGATYLSEKVLIPDTEPVGMLETSWALSGLIGSYGISGIGGGWSSEDHSKSLPALTQCNALFLLLSPEFIISKNYQVAFWMNVGLHMNGKGLGANSGWRLKDLLYHKRKEPGQGHQEKCRRLQAGF